MFNAHNPLGKTCQLRVDYRFGGVFEASSSDVNVIIPDIDKGDYYV